jgi:hypothetical protein
LDGLRFTTRLHCAGAASSSQTPARRFETVHGRKLEIEDSCSLALLHQMLEFTERAPTLAELEACTADGNHAPTDVAQALLGLIARGYAEPRLSLD